MVNFAFQKRGRKWGGGGGGMSTLEARQKGRGKKFLLWRERDRRRGRRIQKWGREKEGRKNLVKRRGEGKAPL